MEHKLNILIVHNRYRYRGGEDIVAENEKTLLESYGHNVFVYERNSTEINKFNIVQKLLLPFATFFSLRTLSEVKKLIKQHHIDVVHIHNTVPLISPSVYAAAKSCGCRVVQTLHNFRFICPNGLLLRDKHICNDCTVAGLHCAVKHKCYRDSALQTILIVNMMRFHRLAGTYRKTDKFIALTDLNKQLLCEALPKLFRDDNVTVKPNFCFGNTHPTALIPARDRQGFLFCGRIDEYKGIFELIEVFSALPNQRLIVLGTGPDYDRAVSSAEQHNCDNITFLGQCDRQTVLEYMSRSRCLIVPSKWYEGFPMTIAEAFSAGTPVMATDIGNAGQLAQMSAGVMPHDDITKWPPLIEHLCNDDVLQSEIDKAYSLYMTRYSAQVSYHKLMEIYCQ